MTTKIGNGSIIVEVWLKTREALIEQAQSPTTGWLIGEAGRGPVDFSKYAHEADICFDPANVMQIGPGNFETECLESAWRLTQSIDENWNHEHPCRSSMVDDVFVLKDTNTGISSTWRIAPVGFVEAK